MKINVDYLRPHKAEGMLELYGKLQYKENLAVESYPDAVILPRKKSLEGVLLGGVADREGNYISGSGCDLTKAGIYTFKCAEERNEKVVYCGYFSSHWGHFLMDDVKRIWYFLQHDETIDKYIFMSNLRGEGLPELPVKNEVEFLKLLGIWDKIEIIDQPTYFREVVIPERSHIYQEYYSDWHKKIFDIVISEALKQCGNKHVKIGKKVFFSRSHLVKKGVAEGRSEAGTKLLDHFFEKNGYEIFYPEELPLAEMIFILQEAEECAMVEGTLPHNLMFARKGTKAVILERRVGYNYCQVYVNEVKNLDVDYIDAYYMFYPVFFGVGVGYLDYTVWMASYAADHEMQPPDEYYLSEKYRRKGFESYMRAFRVRGEVEFDMELLEEPVYWEAYRESLKLFKDYLTGNRYWNTKGVYVHGWFHSLEILKAPVRRMLLRAKESFRSSVDADYYFRLAQFKYKVLGFLRNLHYHDT